VERTTWWTQSYSVHTWTHSVHVHSWRKCRDKLCCRLAVLHAAAELDSRGNKEARLAITAAKAIVPQAVLEVIDVAIQMHGAAGVGQDQKLAGYWGAVRALRLADGPDEVHLISIGKHVIKLASKL
jgi:acyl-CoA dehydrogenase